MKNFAYYELSKDGEQKRIDGMSAGSFRDMFGRPVEFAATDLSVYIDNTRSALESTRDSSGDVVGFPIDVDHNHGKALGWLKGVELNDERNVIEFDVAWTDEGRGLIESDQYRYFSPSINKNEKVIVGGGLTNWPATRDEKENLLLRPIELSQGCYTNENANMMTGIIERVVELMSTGRAETPAPVEIEQDKGETKMDFTELMADPEIKEQFELSVAQAAEERAVELAQAQLDAQQEENETRASVAELKAKGLPIEEEQLFTYLSGQTKEQRAEGIVIMRAIAEAGHVLDFSEHGHQQPSQEKQNLSVEIGNLLQKHLELGGKIGEFFEINPELGEMKQYELSDYKEI